MMNSLVFPTLVSALIPTLRQTVAAGAILLSSTALVAQEASVDLSGFYMPRFGAEPSGQALVDKLPEEAVFIDDAGALELAEGEYSGLQLSEEAKQQVRSYDFDDEFKRENTCVAPSVTFYMQAPFPIEIHQGQELLVMEVEYFDLYRIIFMDGREMPEDHPHSKSGYSIGHWEGEELVVETRFISPGTFMNNGFDTSENIRMTERFRLSEDGDILMLTQVYEDPEVFTGKAARYMAWNREPGGHVLPYECDPSFGSE